MTTHDGADVAELAELFGVHPRHVYRLKRTPGFPAPLATGGYDLFGCGTWYIKFQRAGIARLGMADTPAMATAKLALVAGQAEKIETANRVARGELLEVDSLMVLWSQRVANTQKRLRAIPSSLGPQLTNKSDPTYCVQKISGAIEAALCELNGPAGGCKKPQRHGRRRRA